MKSIFFTTLLALLAVAPALAQNASPVGLWKTFDDVTGKPTALIRIVKLAGGEFNGKIERILLAGENPNSTCKRCVGVEKDQPVIGMSVLNGLKENGDEYSGGNLLDPHTGNVTKSKMSLTDGGMKLKVYAYIGSPMFGRSQTWVRQ